MAEWPTASILDLGTWVCMARRGSTTTAAMTTPLAGPGNRVWVIHRMGIR